MSDLRSALDELDRLAVIRVCRQVADKFREYALAKQAVEECIDRIADLRAAEREPVAWIDAKVIQAWNGGDDGWARACNVRTDANAIPLYDHPAAQDDAALEWISVAERLPAEHQPVLAWLVGGALHHGEDWMERVTYIPSKGGFRMNVGDDDQTVEASHWQPLPTPPALKGRR